MKTEMTNVEMFEMFKEATWNYISVMNKIYESGEVNNIWDDNFVEGTIEGMMEDIMMIGEELGIKWDEDLEII